jgi:hypothetical protein
MLPVPEKARTRSMNRDPNAEMSDLLRAVLGDEDDTAEEDEPGRSPFAIKLAESIGEALRHMRAEGAIEIDDGSLDSVIIEVTESGLDARSPKQLIKRVIRTLIESEYVEEVYGTDDELRALLTASLDGG